MAGRATNMIDAPTRRDRVASEELAGEVRLKGPSKDGQLNPAYRVPDCERTAQTTGYGPRHYQQIRRHGRLTPERERVYVAAGAGGGGAVFFGAAIAKP